MQSMEEMNVDEVVDVPDTPDRLAARRVIGRESVGRDSYSTVDENFRRSDTLNENHVNGLRAKDKPVTQNGHCRRPIIRPPKSFSSHRTMNFVNPNSLSPSENSFASQNSRLFRKVVVDESSSHRGKHTGGVRNMDKGKSILTDKSSHHHEGSNFFDLTKLNVCPGEPKTICPNGVIKDKKKQQISSIGNSSGSCIPESLEMFRNAFMSNEKIDENTPKGSGLATVHGVAVNLSPDSQHKTRERSSPAFTSPRVTGRRCLVRNGCISPQNIAKAELLKSSSRNIEQSYAANGVSNFAPTPRNLVTEIIAEENDNGRMKGKAILTPDTSKKQDDNFFAATSSSFATDSGEANRIINAGRNALGSQGLGGWRSTHCHSGKTDNTSHDVAGRHSRRISCAGSFSHQQHDNRVDRKESRQGHQTECDHAEGEAAVLAARSVSETGQSSGRPRAEKTVTKRLKKQGSTSRTQSECSTSVSEDPDVLFLGPSRESTNPRSSRAQHSEFRDRFCPIIEVDELSPPVRRSTPHNLDRTNDDDDSDARARQVEADEILARELQEQLYHEMPIVGGEEQVDERLAWVLQQEDDVYNTHGASQNLSHARGSMIANLIRQPRSRPAQSQPNRTRSQSNRRGTLARVANSTRMAQLRGRPYRQRRAVSHRARNLQFPLDMDLDMRLDILEALEAVVGDFGDEDMGNPIYRVQRDFNENDYEMLLALDEHNHQHAGAPSNQINSLPQSVVQTDNQEVCAICLESPTIGETVRHLPCLHKFHKDCIDPWLSRKTSCPVCKSSIT